MATHFSRQAHTKPTDAQARHTLLRRVCIAVSATTLGVTALYCVGVWWFGSHFVPGTTIGGTRVGWMGVGEVATLVEEQAAAYANHVTGVGVDLLVTAADIDLDIDGEGYANAALAQSNPYRWPIDAIRPANYDATTAVTFDHEKLAALVEATVASVNEEAAAPVNASGVWNGDAGAFVVADPIAGTMVDATAATETLAYDVATLTENTLLDGSDLVQPAVTADDEGLVAAVDRANAMVALTIPLTKDGTEVASVGANEISSWVSVSPEHTVVIDQGAVVAWSSGDLAAKVASDDEVHVWAIDAEVTAAGIVAAIDTVSPNPVEVAMSIVDERPAESDGARGRGRHIDVNLTNQYARLYDTDGTVLWRSYIVSGNTSNGHGTITGEFSIQSKVREMLLVGLDEDNDGEPDYETPVHYWMPFSGGFGLHDADWRYYFGGTIYTWNGSHGCVNLPVERAAELFDLVSVGDKVVVHW